MTHRHFHGLQANVYEHPFDSRARKSLEKTPGLSLVFKKINEYGIDRLFRFRCTANAIRITHRNFPAIYSAFETACETLAVDPMPSLYLIHGEGYIRTLTIGVTEPIVIVNVDAIERLTEQEWLYVLGHELGHIKSSHLLYHQTAIVLPILGKFIASSTLGLGGIATNGIELALYQWMMMAKLTCDRAGLLACQDTTVATRALIKLAGLPEQFLSQAVIDEFLDQSREFGGYDLDNLDKITKILSFAENMRPWVILRASELLKWIDGGVYAAIVEGTYLFLEGDGQYEAGEQVAGGGAGGGSGGADADWGLDEWGKGEPNPDPRPIAPRGPLLGPLPGPVPGVMQPDRPPRPDRVIPRPAASLDLGSYPASPDRPSDPLGASPPLVEDWSPPPPLPNAPLDDRPLVPGPADPAQPADRPSLSDPDRPSERGKGRRRWDPERFAVGINGDGGSVPSRDRRPLDRPPVSQPPLAPPPLDRPPISLPPPNRPPAARLGDRSRDDLRNPGPRSPALSPAPEPPRDRPPLPPLPRSGRPGDPRRDAPRDRPPLQPNLPLGDRGADDRTIGNPTQWDTNSEADGDWEFLDSWRIP